MQSSYRIVKSETIKYTFMKRILTFTLLLLCSSVAMMAQNTFVATLQHNEEVINYYGMTALQEAYKASETGDVILLSSGVFNSVNIQKGIKVRGVGLGQDDKTVIKGDFDIHSLDASWKTSIEGIYALNNVNVYANDSAVSAGKINLIKSQIGGFNVAATGNPSAASTPIVNIMQNIISSFRINNGWSSVSCYNSLIIQLNNVPTTVLSYVQSTTFINCVFYTNAIEYLRYSVFMNSIIRSDCSNSSDWLPSSAIAYNCLGINKYGYDAFRNLTFGSQQNCSNVRDLTSIFKTFDGNFSNYSETFELTEEGQKYLGTDGTQIGMQGGSAPYSTTMSYPVITNMQADGKTSKDGKLNVKIEVSTGE